MVSFSKFKDVQETNIDGSPRDPKFKAGGDSWGYQVCSETGWFMTKSDIEDSVLTSVNNVQKSYETFCSKWLNEPAYEYWTKTTP